MSLVPITDEQAQQFNPGQYAAHAAQLQPGASLQQTQTGIQSTEQGIVNAKLQQVPLQATSDRLSIINKAGDYFASHPASKGSDWQNNHQLY